MGLFGGNKSASKSSKELRKGINQAQPILDRAYLDVLSAIPGQYDAVQSYLTGPSGSSLSALTDAYTTGRSDLSSSADKQLADIEASRLAQLGYYQPYIQAGQPALSRLVTLTTPGDTSFQADPGYLWRVQQGEKAIQNSAAGKGGVLGGNTLKALEKYRQGVASDEFNNVYGRNLGLATLGYNASTGAAGVDRWAGTSKADVNRWLGQGNLGLDTWYGGQRSGLYGTLADLTGQRNSVVNALTLGRANSMADLTMQRANSSASREAAQPGWGEKLMPLVGIGAGAFLGSSGGLLGKMGSAAGSWLAKKAGLTTVGPSVRADGYGGYSSNSNPWLTGHAMRGW